MNGAYNVKTLHRIFVGNATRIMSVLSALFSNRGFVYLWDLDLRKWNTIRYTECI
jgi:hypothetical protein